MPPVTQSSDPAVVALDTKVNVLDEEISDVNTRLGLLDAKFDKNMSSLGAKFETAIAGLSQQLAEKNKTPWGVLISGAAVVITVLSLLGNQAISPLRDEIRALHDDVVPRKEIEFRSSVNDRRDMELEARLNGVEGRERAAMQGAIESLERENSLLRHGKSD